MKKNNENLKTNGGKKETEEEKSKPILIRVVGLVSFTQDVKLR